MGLVNSARDQLETHHSHKNVHLKKKKKEKKTQMQDAAFSSVPKRVHKIRLDITYFDEN